jgi:hypothetical protein
LGSLEVANAADAHIKEFGRAYRKAKMAMSFASTSAVPGANAQTSNGDEIPEILVEVRVCMLTMLKYLLTMHAVTQLQSPQWREQGQTTASAMAIERPPIVHILPS